jgi:hypothetical protein
MRSGKKNSQPRPKTMRMILLFLIAVELNQRQISRALKAIKDIRQIEEDSCPPDPDSTEEKVPTAGTMLTATTSTATTASNKVTNRKNATKG